jgi:cbb3-type cytochrome oxidase subunit 3
MEDQFHNLYEFMLNTKSVIYVMMGVILILFLGFWSFVFGRDKKSLD